MEAKGSSSINGKNQIVPSTIRTALASAFLEWFLIFLLFIDAIFSYIVTKFAGFCQLQIPCLLCSRLDHVLGKEKAGFYWDLVCQKHKLKISSLVYCHLHEKLVDVHGMCESCLFSFATVNKSNAETYRLLVGKLGDEPRLELHPDFLIADDNSSFLNGRKCTCCNEQFISRGHVEMTFQTKTIGYRAADFDAGLVATNGPDSVELKELRDVLFQKVKASASAELDIDLLPHVEYQKVKTASDTESIGYEAADLKEPLLATRGHDEDGLKEVLDVSSQKVLASLSGKDDTGSLLHVEYEKVKDASDTESIGYVAAGPDAPLLTTNGRDKNKLKDFTDESSLEVKASQAGKNDIDHLPHVEYEKVKINSDTESEASFSDEDSASSPINVFDGNQNLASEYRGKDIIVEDLASEEVLNPSDVPLPSTLDSEVHVKANDLRVMESPAPSGCGLEELYWQHIEHKTDAVAPEHVTSSDILPSSNATQSSANVPEETYNFKVANLGKAASKDHDEMAELASNLMATNKKQSDLKSTISDTSSQAPNLLELGDAYKLAVGSRGRQLSGKLLEQKSFKDSASVSEDFKLLLSQLSAARRIELQLNDMSPMVSGNIDELRTDSSGSIGMQILQKRISLERNESGISLNGSIVSEIEGESVVDRLKRQVEHDKKLMGALYKELEEERNASADAVSQAMAMITRLQEEKAALHMEALQCLRMMEEQAEYDGEALQKATDLLAEKEKEIHDLVAELEAHKKMLGCISPEAYSREPNCDFNALETNIEKFETGLEQRNATVCSTGDIISTTCCKDDDTSCSTGDGDICLRRSFAFEDESLNILQCLKELEKKLELFSSSHSFPETVNGNFSEEEQIEMANRKQIDYRCGTLENGETNVDMKNSLVNTESCSASEGSAFQHEDSEHESKGSGELQPGKHFFRDIDLDALRNEFLVLNNRLKALEVEHGFLKHSVNSVSKGDGGLKFIQEMACQVRELHSLGIRRKN